MGLVTLSAGLYALWARPAVAVFLLMFFTIANAAGTLSIGAATIPPVNLFALMFVLRALMLPDGPSISLQAMSPGRPGFVLLILIAFAVLSAFFFPRILQGVTYIFYPDRTISEAEAALARPLVPGSGNITQPMYALQGLAIFAVTHAYARHVGAAVFLRALVYLALLNVGFAIFDIVTYAAGMEFLMDPLRSGGYQMHVGQTVSGIRRIIGTFPEPSAFAAFSFCMFAAMFVMWQRGFGGRAVFLAMIGNLIALLLSTSTTGYAALTIFGLLILGWLLYALAVTGWSRPAISAAIGLVAVCLFVAMLAVLDAVPATVADILSQTLNKSQSASGLERAAGNAQAWINFVDTWGVGAGLGSVRASGFGYVLLSNLGVFGTLLFTAFTLIVLFAPTQAPSQTQRTLALVAKGQIVAILICAGISAGVFDLGTQFYLFAGLISATALVTRSIGSRAGELQTVSHRAH